MNKSRLLGVLYASVVTMSCMVDVAQASSIVITDNAEAGFVRSDGFTGTIDIEILNNSNWTFIDQGIAEFNISGVGYTSVSSAVVKLKNALVANGLSLPTLIDVYGYIGDGFVTFTDFDAGSFIKSVIYSGSSNFDIDVTDFINSQLGITTQIVGFNFRFPGPTSPSLSFLAFDGLDSVNPPLLTLTAIPLPPAFWLLGSGLLGLIGIAKRKKSA